MDDQAQPQFDYQSSDDLQKQSAQPPVDDGGYTFGPPPPPPQDSTMPSTPPPIAPPIPGEMPFQPPVSMAPPLNNDLSASPGLPVDMPPNEPPINNQGFPPLSPSPMPGNNTTMPSQASDTIYTGLSGNELYCLNLSGYQPGNLVVGNSVYALGFVGSLASNIRTKIGGEIQQFTEMISGGRKLSLQRLEQELTKLGGHGATGVTSELVFHPGNIEFLSIGSSIYKQEGQPTTTLTTASDGQEFFCQMDAGYMPMRFVLGNVAYSIGIGRNILGEFKEMVKGEISQYSNIFNITRNIALQRIVQEAKDCGANSVVGIRTTILPIGTNGVQEMVMIGTASYNEQINSIAGNVGGVITSDLTAEEMWNVTKLGYVPMKLILGTSVFSLGVVGGLRAAVRGFVKGEISTLTQLIYGARQQSLKKVQAQAQEIGADDVLGIKTYIYQLNGDVIEFLAIGTAVKRVNGITPHSDQIPPQAIIRDKNTFVNNADTAYNTSLNQTSVDHQDQKNIV